MHTEASFCALLLCIKQADGELMTLVDAAAAAKTAQSSELRRRLLEVSSLQSRIQEILNWLRLMRRARDEKEEQFSHLEKVMNL